jgi:hypothetical protein
MDFTPEDMEAVQADDAIQDQRITICEVLPIARDELDPGYRPSERGRGSHRA